MSRLVDRGAITAAFVGIGMALTIGVSFLLVIPIEPVYWALSVPAGLLIGYYADARSGRGRGAWRRILANSLFAGVVTGLTLAALLIGVKALFFAADDGYRDPGLGGRLSCVPGGDCVYRRYLEDQPDALAAAGVTDAASFSTFFWAQQWSTAALLVMLSTGFGVAGGVIYGVTRPRPGEPAQTGVAAIPDETGTGLPSFARTALGQSAVRSATFRTSAIGGSRTEAWAAEVPGDIAIRLWERLRSSADHGWWPLVLGGHDDETRLADAAREQDLSMAGIVEAAAALVPESLFAEWRAEQAAYEDDERDLAGTWPEQPPGKMSFTLPLDIQSGRPRETVVAVVHVEAGFLLPAALAWGGWNACPPPEAHVAVLRRWAALYGAEVVGMSGDVIEMRVTRPPSTRDAALALAWEQYAYCPDIVDQGLESVSALAAVLLDSSTWYFWWD